MYHGTLKKPVFQPDPSALKYEKQRNEYVERLKGTVQSAPPVPARIVEEERREKRENRENKESLAALLEKICPEDGALIALILFLLCDNTENDVVLLGILLYVLLAAD